MTLAFSAQSTLRGGQAALALAWSSPAGQARSLRVVRQVRNIPAQPDDGRVVLDLADLFGTAGAPWARVLAWRFLLGAGPNPSAGGASQAALLQFFAAPGDAQPKRVVVRIGAQSWAFDGVSRVTLATAATPAFGQVLTAAVFTTPAGGAETLGGTAVISAQPTAPGPATTVVDYTQGDTPQTRATTGTAPSLFAWTPAGAPTQTVPFATEQVRSTVATVGGAAPLQVRFVTSVVPPGWAGTLPLGVTDASGGAPIVVTLAAAHGLTTGNAITILGATGNTAANGDWTVTVLTPTVLTLDGSTGNGAYAGGGTAYPPVAGTADFTEAANPVSLQIDRSLAIADRDPDLPPGGTVYYAAFQDSGAGLASAASASVLVGGRHGFSARLFAQLPAVHRFYDNPASGQGGSWQLRRFLGIFGAALDQVQDSADALASLHDPLSARADDLPYLAQSIGWPLDLTLSTERQRGDILFAPEVFGTIGTVPNLQALANRTTGWTARVKEYVDNVLLTNAVEPIRLWQIFEATAATPAVAFGRPAIQADIYPLPAEPAVSQADPARVDASPAAIMGPGGTVWLFWHSTRLGSEWQAATAYAAGATPSVLAPLSADGMVFECTTAGTSGAAPPAFPAVAGATVADGTAVWTCRGPGQVRRRIWLQRLGADPTPVDVVADLPQADGVYDEAPSVTRIGTTIWLAWASNRSGHPEIWIRAWVGAAPGPARPLTQQKVENRTPALACSGAAGAPITAAWASTRSGQAAIWTSRSTDSGATWSAPAVATPGPRDHAPTVAVDSGGQVHLFWSADAGVSSQIRHATLPGAGGATDVTDATPGLHDEAPAAVLWQGTLRLFWHSNRFAVPWTPGTAFALGTFAVPTPGNGLWYECTVAGTGGAAAPAFPTATGATVLDGAAVWTCRGALADAVLARRTRVWSAAGPGFLNAAPVAFGPASAMQPAPVVEAAGDLRLFLASQEGGVRFRSRTIDTRVAPTTDRLPMANALAKASMGDYVDRLHYTYDTRRVPQAVVARDTAGLFLSPGDGQTDAQHLATVERLRAFLSPFRPVTTRLVYFVEPSAGLGFTPLVSDP